VTKASERPGAEASDALAAASRKRRAVPRWRVWLTRLPQRHQVGLRVLLLLGVFAAGLTLLPRQPGYERAEYAVGTVVAQPVIAEFDFNILKDEAQLEREQREAMAAVPPVLVRQDSVRIEALAALDRFAARIEQMRRDPEAAQLEDDSGVTISQSAFGLLLSHGAEAAVTGARERLADFYERGIVSADVAARLAEVERATLVVAGIDWVGPTDRFVTPPVLAELRGRASTPAGRLVAELTSAFAWPNVAWDEAATAQRCEIARDAVDPSLGRVLKGEAIVDAHERIWPEDLRKLESYEYWRERRADTFLLRERVFSVAGRALVLALALGVLVLFVASYRPGLIEVGRDTLLFALIHAVALLLGALALNLLQLSPFLIPVAAFGVLVTLLFDEPLALLSSAFLTLTIGIVTGSGVEFIVVVGLGCVAAILRVRRLQDRRQLYRLLLFVPLAHLVALGAIALLQARAIENVLADALYLVANPFIAAGIALFAVPLSEAVFEKCTNLTLLELLDLNRPLLRRLMLEAPGTYHHSLMVGTLAEAGAAAVDANPLLARVSGYYHDIGKVTKPEYFIENQMAGRKNPHDKLSPTMSRLILESHVRDGVALAKESRLPRVVRDGIEQHHATGLMSYFYHKARERDPDTPESEYRYPGPRPRSRETAILLLADQIDAASRSLEDPTPSRLRGVVKQVIAKRATEGELDESRLTLRDLATLREAFVPILTALFLGRSSGRILYPKPESNRAASGSHPESTAKAEG